MTPTKIIDLTGETCPMNWVRTKLALEAMATGETLEVWLDAGEPATSVPKSAAAEGHTIRSATPRAGGPCARGYKEGVKFLTSRQAFRLVFRSLFSCQIARQIVCQITGI